MFGDDTYTLDLRGLNKYMFKKHQRIRVSKTF